MLRTITNSHRTKRPLIRLLAAAGVVALLAQTVAAAPAACSFVHDDGSAEVAHGATHEAGHAAMHMAGELQAADDGRSADTPFSDCAMMDHCASWVTAHAPAAPSILTHAESPHYGTPWQLHLGISGHLTPPPKA